MLSMRLESLRVTRLSLAMCVMRLSVLMACAMRLVRSRNLVVVVVVGLLFYVHGKHLRSCRDGQLT